ncbi:hypothetical protein DJ82_04615 [Halorubrum sp. Ib24]|uniref:DUF1328 family protein n=1 Tax=unclassified Halorubrum TaxID=2642239 RepID=UPI000B97DC00|nr:MULTISPECIES: DUF1328 family protein [unclassified Halorubrum]OYR41694.1 hypothetical protein DJ82_04615 [Halorubrum sp. Ib24]OYR46239.1 hypothetical protein DJ75_06235 [Halorubrum sp. Eb13]OYR47810.1 hypothetical protein DJ81_00320 [Halorubrum sp. Hd13]OYR48652.1 hypothetical protein DJ74_10275 [Halorubrum sp. Ea8]OYR54513.1 hypothetical protein DJ73_04935 [Halorubrum sp. Ea1]
MAVTPLTPSFDLSPSSGIGAPPLQFSGDFLELAVVFFLIAIVAAIFGARGVAGVSMAAAKWLVIVFVVLAIISVLL